MLAKLFHPSLLGLIISLGLFQPHGTLHAQILKSPFEVMEQFPNSYQRPSQETGKVYHINEGMNPFYLEADFTGDGTLDVAFAVIDVATQKQGILIQHGEDHTYHVLGAGIPFHVMDNLDWMDIWKVYREKTAEITLFSEDFDIIGSETVPLNNPAIEVSQSEASYNLITWDGNQYVWVHTGE